jgi:hypothetical protein
VLGLVYVIIEDYNVLLSLSARTFEENCGKPWT